MIDRDSREGCQSGLIIVAETVVSGQHESALNDFNLGNCVGRAGASL